MNFAIIAAGEGSRLNQEGVQVSKPMVKINGVPMIERLLDLAMRNSATSISCIINEESAELKKYLEEQNFGIPFNLVVKSTPSSLHSLHTLREFLSDDYFCLTTVDTIFKEEEFIRYISYCEANKENRGGILAVTSFIDDEKPLCVTLDDEMLIQSFDDELTDQEYATGGIYFFDPKIFDIMDEAINFGMMRLRNFQRLLLEHKFKLEAFPFTKIVDVDHVGDIEKAEKFLSGLS